MVGAHSGHKTHDVIAGPITGEGPNATHHQEGPHPAHHKKNGRTRARHEEGPCKPAPS